MIEAPSPTANAATEDRDISPSPSGKNLDETVMDLSERAEELADGQRGLDRNITTEAPPHDHVRTVATRLLFIFGGCLFLILGLATAVAYFRPEVLKDMINFFATIVAMLGTLLGGVVAFYFTRK
jgi:hypothetical protein